MKKTLKITLIVVLSILTLSIVASIYSILNKPNIYNGVKIEGLDVGNRSKDETEIYLKDKFNEVMESKEILFTSDNYSKNIKYKDLGIEYNYDKAVQQAYDICRSGNVFERLKDIADISFNDKNIKLELKTNAETLNQAIEQINQEVSIDKKDSTITYSNGSFIVTDETVGISVDVGLLKKEIERSINKFQAIELPIKKDLPKATREELSKVKEEIGTYSTTFKMNDLNRVYNVTRAAGSIDNKLLLPGEIFSFNKATGPRSLKAGYKEATVIINGEFVPGEGGGVCQVSSTLYNTLLDSGVDIVERHKHTLPVPYVPLGNDATVAYDYLDLKFKNNYTAPIYIKSYIVGNTLTVKIYGDKSLKL